VLRELDVERLWSEATEHERRILVQELVEEVAVLPDHLEVKIAGAPRLNVLLSEVGLKDVSFGGVGGGVRMTKLAHTGLVVFSRSLS
jgi:hypothetical protein